MGDKGDVCSCGATKSAFEPDCADKCIVCGKVAMWTVNWLLPQHGSDNRLVCSSACAVKAVSL